MEHAHDEPGDPGDPARAAAADDESAVDTRPAMPAEDETVEAEERELVWAAWRSLPDESRSLLWRLVVHEERPHQIAPGLGTTPGGVVSRGDRARERLRRALLSELVATAGEAPCREARRQLSGYVRGSMPAAARERVEDHLDTCPRCRAAVADLADVDAAIRLRVAPMLLPGAFAVASADDATPVRAVATAPEPVRVGGPTGVPDRDTAGRVLSVPGRSAAVVLAAVAVVVATALFLLRLDPAGGVAGEAPVALGTATARPDGAEPTDPDAGAVSLSTDGSTDVATVEGPSPVIGAATAQSISRYQPSGGRSGGGPATAGTGRAGRQGGSVLPATSTSSTSSTQGSSSVTSLASPPTPSRPASGTPNGVVGTVTTLSFSPSDRSYVARLAASAGWVITSVRDVRGARVREHVTTPTSVYDGRLAAGALVVEVTRVRPDVRGVLTARFTSSSGTTQPGSGDYPLR